MANSAVLYARIDSEVKSSAESILEQLGITPAVAIQMLYKQIIIHQGIPFALKLPVKKPITVGSLTREELDAELMKGVQSIKSGNTFTDDEVDTMLSKELGI